MLEDLLRINKYALDDELLTQPQLYQRYSDELAICEGERDAIKFELEQIEAELSGKYRKENTKVTEKALKDLVILDAEYTDYFKKYIIAKTKAKKLSGFVTALEQRKSSLEYLIKLFLAGYFGEVRVPKTDRDGMEQVNRDAQQDGLKDNPRIRRRT
jgi:hypothetical protein